VSEVAALRLLDDFVQSDLENYESQRGHGRPRCLSLHRAPTCTLATSRLTVMARTGRQQLQAGVSPATAQNMCIIAAVRCR
jgi:hypothetical protein